MIKVQEILSFLSELSVKYKYEGEKFFSFETYCPLNNLKSNSITWVRNANTLNTKQLNLHKGIMLVAELDAKIVGAEFPIIYAENAHRTFFRILEHFFSSDNPEYRSPGIATTAIVETKDYGENLYVGHHTYIGPEVKIGCNVSILHNVTIQGRVIIGDYSVIESGTTIGACGYGHYRDEEGNPYCVPHLGGVVIGKHVKIGANNAVSRGCLSDTVIEDFVKTDNLCHIAHNDIIKRRAMLTANTVISGSSIISENAWLAPGSLVNNSIQIGENAYMGIGAVATKDVPEGKVVVGMPAKVLRDR